MSQDDVDEPCLQTYFEQHPAMLLQIVGHCPMHCSLITQPDLIGTYIRRPDFMMIAKDSGEWRPILIEIESPEKRIFTKDGKTRSDFNHARDQLTEWRSWFRDHSNVDQFKERYGIPNYIERELMMRMETVLIYGRRSEFDGNPNLTKFRASLMKPSEHLMSFDRLSSLKMNDLDCQIAMTIKPTGSGHFQAVWVPETFSLGPEFADRLHYISGIESAIYNNPNISDERKRFLVERIDYWKTWSRSNSGTYVGGHRE
ncbi:MAG: DUF4263 domain-containing protein [Spirochaetaceae bacterium]|nr:DUF4263 domain-containing protein [Spirochaetaceae bacterium]